MSKRSRVILALLVLIVVIGGAAAVALDWAMRTLDRPLTLSSPLRFKVPTGSSFAHVANDLAAQGVVAEPRVWILYARYKHLAQAVKAGEYEVQPGTTARELLSKMVSGQVLLHSFTIVDGWRFADMVEALKHNPDVKVTLAAIEPGSLGAEVMKQLGQADVDAEGQFLPETYKFIAGTTDLEVLKQAHAALQRELEAAWAGRASDVPLHNVQELLIMASIIEKESGLPQELPKIAGLYLHRLAIGMRLEADPTVIYGLGERYDGTIHTVDLRTDTPYNTYTRMGLPPGPISLPSSAVLRATAHPEKTDALFFVASVRGDGSHVFSATYEEHKVAVAALVAHQRKAAQGAPR